MKNYLGKLIVLFILGFCPNKCFSENITVIGVGRLGLSFALCLEKAGYDVLGVDVLPEYVDQLNDKFFDSTEPFINGLLESSQRFKATTSLKEGLDFSDICFITITTTHGTDGYDFSLLSELLSKINLYSPANKKIVICSTIKPGYIKEYASSLLADCPSTTICYNPPFIAQGEIVNGLCNPDMVLIGEGSNESGALLEKIYKQLCKNSPYIARMSVESAEITKLALNCFITAKISFANLIGDIADKTFGANKFDILHAIGKDRRIGEKCILPGFGFGGPCFPRDNKALGEYSALKEIDPIFFETTDLVNSQHAEYMAQELTNKDLSDYVFENVAYKENCPVPMIDASQKLVVAKKLVERGKSVTIRDFEPIIERVREKFGDIFNYETKY